MQLAWNRELDEYFTQANDQMEIIDGLIREMRQMGQPCDAYQKRYCLQSTEGGPLAGDFRRSPCIPQEQFPHLGFCSFIWFKDKAANFFFHGPPPRDALRIKQTCKNKTTTKKTLQKTLALPGNGSRAL